MWYLPILFTLVLSSRLLAGGAAVQWTEGEGGNGHWYQGILYPGGCTSIEATAAAESMGGHLVSLGTEAEDSWVRSNPASDFSLWANNGIEGPWIGAVNYSDAWEWVDGTSWSFTNWWPGNPGDCCPADVSLWEYSAGRLWQDHSQGVGVFTSYLVEWSADCNGDGIVDYGQILDGTFEDTNGNGVPDCCDAGEPCDGSNPDAVQWTEAEGGNGHWYQAVREVDPLSWLEAKQNAENQGGHLATLSTGPENDLVKYQLANDTALWENDPNGCLCLGPYIGARRDAGGPWTWVDGSEWSFTDWHPNTPVIDEAVPAAVRFWDVANSFNGYAWIDRYLEEDAYPSSSYIIEWSADCNDDGLVDYGQILDGSLADDDGDGVPDLCQGSEAEFAVDDAIQWLVEDDGTGNWYSVIRFDVIVPWSTMRDTAESLGGTLASASTTAENSWIQENIASDSSLWSDNGGGDCICVGPYLGAYRASFGEWTWIDGSDWNETSWHPGNPGEDSSVAASVVYWDLYGTFGWQDFEVTDGVGFYSEYGIIEWSADCNGDGIVDYGQILDGTYEDTNGNGVPDCCEDLTCNSALQWSTSVGGNGHWYALDTTEYCSHEEARLAAESMGGHLVSITSAGEDDFIDVIIDESGPHLTDIHAGGRYVNGAWEWDTGEPWGFEDWGPNLPTEDALWMEIIGREDQPKFYLHWGNVEDGYCQYALIEWSADCNGDGIVDYGQIRDGSLEDVDGNGIPDICEAIQWLPQDGGNGHWYQVIKEFTPPDTGLTWAESRSRAIEVGGDLASLETDSEVNWVYDQLASNPSWWWDNSGEIDGPYLGGFQDSSADDYQEPAGGWYWLTGEPLQSDYWGAGAPNNSGPQDYLHFWIAGSEIALAFDDVAGDDTGGGFAYVVEWSADCNGDGIVDYGQIVDGSYEDLDEDGVLDCCQDASCLADPGACCLAGSCTTATESDCLTQGGFWYPVADCVDVSCPGTTVTVCSSGCDFVDLQSAVDYLGGQGTIELQSGTYLGDGDAVVVLPSTGIVLRGVGDASSIIIDGEGQRRGILIQGSDGSPDQANATIIENLSIRYGWSGTIDGTGAGNGGGLLVEHASPVIRECLFGFNSACGEGGAIFIDEGSPDLIDCQFNENVAGSRGGAISSVLATTLDVDDCTFDSNRVESQSGACGAGLRGASGSNHVLEMLSWPDAAVIPHHPSLNPADAMTIEFWMDTQSPDSGRVITKRPGSGGCYSLYGSLYWVDEDCTAGNDVFGSCGGAHWFGIPCGWNHLALVVDGATGNSYSYTNGVLVSTHEGGSSCTIAQESSDLRFGNTNGYSATQFAGRIDNVRIWGAALSESDIRYWMNTEITPAIAAELPELGGSWNFEDGITDATGVNNGSLSGGASLVADDIGFGAGGAIASWQSNMDLADCSFIGNSVGFDEENAWPGYGGAISSWHGQLNHSQCSFDGNYAKTYGGGVHVNNSVVSGQDALFTANTAAVQGGAMHLSESGDTGVMNGCVFTDNQSADAGGVYLYKSGLAFESCVFNDNEATLSGGEGLGGGIYASESMAIFQYCEVRNNMAATGGGGIYVLDEAELITLEAATICGNTPDQILGEYEVIGDGNYIEPDCDASSFSRWINPSGGLFEDASNWSTIAAPNQNSTAILDLSSTYTIAFGADAQTGAFLARNGNVTLDLAGHAYAVSVPGGVAVIGQANGDVASLHIDGGEMQIGEGSELLIGFDSGSLGLLEVSGSGSSLMVEEKLQIGDRGMGSMTMRDGGFVSVGRLSIGDTVGSNGSLLLEGDGTVLTAIDECSVNRGSIELQSPAQLRFDNEDGPMTIFKGGTIFGDGFIEGYLLNRGTFAPTCPRQHSRCLVTTEIVAYSSRRSAKPCTPGWKFPAMTSGTAKHALQAGCSCNLTKASCRRSMMNSRCCWQRIVSGTPSTWPSCPIWETIGT